MTLKGKRFLITQSSLRLIAGSEINTLELAEYLKQQGAIVTVYTYFFSDPIARYFRQKRIKVLTDENKLRASDFDYVWVHHQVIPVTFIDNLGSNGPVFIFLHMSGLKSHYLEQPHIWDLEKKISSKTLFISNESKNRINQHSIDISALDTELYRNPAPEAFSRVKHTHRKQVENILIVSNHPAPEVLEAKTILRSKGYNVVSAGEDQDEYKLITPGYLRKFDCVVTIGKTVQYCLVANVPVYIYDTWGGPGYLNSSNEESAARHNFSGRSFKTKSATKIAQEIIERYPQASQYQNDQHQRFVSELSIDKVVPKIIDSVKPRQISHMNKYYKQYLVGSLVMLKYKFYHENLLTWRDSELRTTQFELARKNRENYEILENMEREISQRDKLIRELYGSASYRAGRVITFPIRLLKSIFK